MLLSVLELDKISIDEVMIPKNEIIGILPMHVDDGKLRATSECAKELFDNFNNYLVWYIQSSFYDCNLFFN